MSIGSIVASPVAGAGLVGGATPTSFHIFNGYFYMVTHLEGETGIPCYLFCGSDIRAYVPAWVNNIVYVSLYCVLLAFERGHGPAAVATCQVSKAAASAAPSAVVVASAVSSASASPSASIGSGDIPR